MSNYKAPLIKSLGEAGLSTTEWGFARMTFTQARKNGTRRIKLWLANDVWDASPKVQRKLERRLRANYGPKYMGGYFVLGARGGLGGSRSFCVVIEEESELREDRGTMRGMR